jgi:hypothetical protein
MIRFFNRYGELEGIRIVEAKSLAAVNRKANKILRSAYVDPSSINIEKDIFSGGTMQTWRVW